MVKHFLMLSLFALHITLEKYIIPVFRMKVFERLLELVFLRRFFQLHYFVQLPRAPDFLQVIPHLRRVIAKYLFGVVTSACDVRPPVPKCERDEASTVQRCISCWRPTIFFQIQTVSSPHLLDVIQGGGGREMNALQPRFCTLSCFHILYQLSQIANVAYEKVVVLGEKDVRSIDEENIEGSDDGLGGSMSMRQLQQSDAPIQERSKWSFPAVDFLLKKL
mmetsp:Transcript_12943/g.31545  ORF Transcript_12943/g.31545 Transcript_12943/m.31545 type:complete len:220 (-) Transcript_12943:318-977(-)